MPKRSRLARLQSERLGRLVVSALLSLPLVADPIAQLFGYEVFYLADAKLQVVWGSLALFLGGWPLYAMALRRVQGKFAGFAALASLLYGVALYQALVHAGPGRLFLAAAGVILLAYLLDYLAARRRSSPSM